MIKVLGLALYGSVAASTRYRLLQYQSLLREHDIDLDVHSLLSNIYLTRRFRGASQPIGNMLTSGVLRLKQLICQGNYDCAIVHCEMFPLLPGIIESRLLKIPYIYDFDDAFYLKYRSKRYRYVSSFLENKFSSVISRASAVSAGNTILKNYADGFSDNTHLMPTVVDVNRYKVLVNNENTKFTVGWIGSPSTSQYLDKIVTPLSMLGNSDSIRLTVIGGKAPSILNIEVVELFWQEDTEVQEINNFDIGIMPLPDNSWERGKCGFKLIQYMACGLPVVASPVGVNCEIVEHGVNGFLAETPEEWEIALRTLLSDPELRKRMGKAGREKIERQYSLQVTGPRLTELLKTIAVRS